MTNFWEHYVNTYGQNPETIVEIGSRDGHDARYLCDLSQRPLSDAFVFEAHPECAKRIMAEYPAMHVYPLAVARQTGVAMFRAYDMTLPAHEVGMSSLLPLNTDMWRPSGLDMSVHERQPWVPVMTITGKEVVALVNRPRIDLMKVDVEGMALDVLAGFGETLTQVQFVHVECELRENWIGQPGGVHEVETLLGEAGFRMVYRFQNYVNQIDVCWGRV
jgi:FkbM family methyltransferase